MTVATPTPSKLTPPELAKRWGVSPTTVIGWIRSGELRAIDVARRGARRPRYRIDVADVLAFESGRTVVPEERAPRRRRREAGEVIQYF